MRDPPWPIPTQPRASDSLIFLSSLISSRGHNSLLWEVYRACLVVTNNHMLVQSNQLPVDCSGYNSQVNFNVTHTHTHCNLVANTQSSTSDVYVHSLEVWKSQSLLGRPSAGDDFCPTTLAPGPCRLCAASAQGQLRELNPTTETW